MKRTILMTFAALAGVCLAAAVPVRAASAGIDEKKIEEIAKSVSPSVVRVEARNGIYKVATGVVIGKDGSIVTTALISPRDEKITVVALDGKSYRAEFKGFDTVTGLAVVRAKDANLAPVAMGKSSDLRPGAWIGVIGLSPERAPAVTQGIVSSVADDWVRLNVWVVPGMSGSPVVNANGQMVGLLRGAYMDEQPLFFQFREQQVVGSGTVFSRAEAPSSGMAQAVPVDIVTSVAAEIRKSGKVERGWLGVAVGEEEGKVVIAEVDAKSPAEMAKLKEGDVIVKVGDREIATREALSREIRNRKPGTDVTLRIERDGKLLDVKVKLGEYSETEARRELELNFPGFFNIGPPERILERPRAAGPPETPQPARPWRYEFFTRKYIGVTLQAVTGDLAAYFGVKEGRGLLVVEVTAGSPAEKAGLKAGDVILRADGKSLESADELSEMLQGKKKGDKVKLEILRDKKPQTFEVEVGEEKEGFEAWSWSGTPKTSRDILSLDERVRKIAEEATKAYENQARIQGQRIREFEKQTEEARKRSEEALKKALEESRKSQKDLLRIMKLKGVYYKV
jgi:S1-C subfamily serine protease